MRITWSRAVHVEKEKRARTYKVGNNGVISMESCSLRVRAWMALEFLRPLTGPHDQRRKAE